MALAPKKTALITGAAGFIGSNLCARFLAKNYRVAAIEHYRSHDWRLSGLSGLERRWMDIGSMRAARKLKALISKSPAVFINCAAYGAYPHQTDPRQIYRVNFEAVKNLLEVLKDDPGLEAFIQIGSSSEYGKNCSAPKESSAVWPDSHYAVSKAAATAAVQFYAQKFNIPAWVLRVYSVYGPYEEITRLIPTLLLAAQEERLPPLVSPKISRDFLYVDDLAEAIDRVIERSASLRRGEIYNIGTGRKMTLKELVALVRKLYRVKSKPIWQSMPDRHWDNTDWCSDPRKAAKELGWKSRTSLGEGLQKTMRWLIAHPDLVRAAARNSALKKRR